MMQRVFTCALAVAVASALTLAGCGGGGGSGAAVRTGPSGGGAAGGGSSSGSGGASGGGSGVTTPPTGGSGTSTFSIDSNPRGLAVSLDGTAAGVTPTTLSPGPSNAPHTLTVGGTYQVPITQNYDGNHAVFFNKAANTAGSVNTASISALAHLRRTAAVTASAVHRALSSARHTGSISTTQVAVTYDARALAAAGRRAADVERAEQTDGSDLHADADTTVRTVRVPAGIGVDAFAHRLAQHSEVRKVDFLHTRALLSTTPVTPNDTYFDQNDQWDMYHIGMPNAWGYTKGDGAKIAIIDTGYDAHNADLASKVAYAETVLNGTVTTGSAQDTDGHGTNVSGIAADATNNAFGFAGTAWNAQLLEFKIFPNATSSTPSPEATTSDEAKAIYDAVAMGADVINLSLGATQDTGFDATEHQAVENAIANGVVVVAASGNEGQTVTTVDYPGAYAGVISVGATTIADNGSLDPSSPEAVASYSNAGPGLGLVAPGGDPSSASDADVLHWIYNISTTTAGVAANRCSDPNDCKALFAGTSQATPHVSGAVALIAAIAGHRALAPARIAELLESTADSIGDPKQGHGRLNVYRALAAIKGDTTGAPYKPVPAQLVAFAYTNSGHNAFAPIDITYPNGVPVSSSGTFEIGDVPASTGSYRIAVWFDANGDGVIDAGDQFGVSGVCTANASCASASGITLSQVAQGFTLP